MTPRTFSRIQYFKLNIHAPRHRGKVAIPLHLFLGVGKANTAVAVVVIYWVIRIGSQVFVQVDRMGFQTHHRLVHAKIRNLRGGMPCGA